jgi:hypothetical protein
LLSDSAAPGERGENLYTHRFIRMNANRTNVAAMNIQRSVYNP